MESNEDAGDGLVGDVVSLQVIHEFLDAEFECADAFAHEVLSDSFQLAALDEFGCGWVELTDGGVHLAFLAVEGAEFAQ